MNREKKYRIDKIWQETKVYDIVECYFANDEKKQGKYMIIQIIIGVGEVVLMSMYQRRAKKFQMQLKIMMNGQNI